MEDVKTPFAKGEYANKMMSELPPREVLHLYYTNHFVGPPRQWVVSNMKRLKHEAQWTDQDTKKYTRI